MTIGLFVYKLHQSELGTEKIRNIVAKYLIIISKRLKNFSLVLSMVAFTHNYYQNGTTPVSTIKNFNEIVCIGVIGPC